METVTEVEFVLHTCPIIQTRLTPFLVTASADQFCRGPFTATVDHCWVVWLVRLVGIEGREEHGQIEYSG